MAEMILEAVDMQSIVTEILEEQSNTGLIKNYYIKGPFLQCDLKNGNGRIYPLAIGEREVRKINEGKISQNRCLGELGHPSTTEINLDRVSHVIQELKMEGNTGIGKARIIDTPMGKISKALLESGVKLGVSTRGVGTMKESIVQGDFRLITVDIVADPSGPGCFVDSMLESKKEWILENGILTEREIDDALGKVDDIVIEYKYSSEEKSAAFLKLFSDLMESIKSKKS